MKKKIEIKKNIAEGNDSLAIGIKERLDKAGVFSINVMASPGAGKTSLIVETIRRLRKKYRMGVIDGDVSDIDVQRLKKEKVPVVLANTGGACHLDAVMVNKALLKLKLEEVDVLIVENVGNLICPANFALGTHKQVVVASVPEGDDKPHKYPGMFLGADVILLNKMDYQQVDNFDLEFFRAGVDKVNGRALVISLSCKTGEGVQEWIDWLEKEMKT